MRKLKLDEGALVKLLNELDAHDARHEAKGRSEQEVYCYRVPAMRVDLDVSRDETLSHRVPTRKLSPDGIYFLVSQLIHTDSSCRVHLVTVRNNWQTVPGRISTCRYLPGSGGVHEVFVKFDRPIDPATFAASAIRARILACDDSKVSQKLYERLLATMNVELTCVSNGIEAVERGINENFDLILMDLEMPEMDGLTAARLLRSKGYVRSIVCVSAMSSEADRQRCIDAGCDDFLAKPVTRESLAQVVNRNKSEPLVSSMLDDSGMVELIDHFVDGLKPAVTQLESAFGQQNREELARVARAVKGEAAGVGFTPITDTATGLEDAVNRGDDLESIRPRLTELIRLCMSARPASSRRPEEVAAGDTDLVETGDAAPADE